MRGAIVLAGGPSMRFGRPKAVVPFRGRALVLHVVDAARAVAGELVIVSRGRLVATLADILPADAVLLRDRSRVQSPLVGLVAGAGYLRSPYVAALACDLPFVRGPLLSRLFRSAHGHDAAIPRWPDGRIEPLVAVYRRSSLLSSARRALASGERANQEMIRRLRRVRYVSTEELRRADPDLRSFTNVNTPGDLARAERS